MSLKDEQLQWELDSWGVYRFEGYGKNLVLRRCTEPFSYYIKKIQVSQAQSTRAKEMLQWLKDSRLSPTLISYISIHSVLEFFYSYKTQFHSTLVRKIERTLREESRLYRISLEHPIAHVIVKEKMKGLAQRLAQLPPVSEIKEPSQVVNLLAEWIVAGLIQCRFIQCEERKIMIGNELKAFIQQNKQKDFTQRRVPPSLIPPQNWTSLKKGGFLTQHQMRLVKHVQDYQKSAFTPQSIPLEYSTINGLQSIPYKLNPFIKKTLQSLLDEDCVLKFFNIKNYTVSEAKSFAEDRFIREFCSVLEVVKKIGRKTFYNVWGMDYRGRKYSKGRVSFQGSDYVRALFLFKKGKPLSFDGVVNLAIHGANLFGIKGNTVTRHSWVNKNQEVIIECAKNPLDMTFWLDASNPFQFLAFCEEWRKFRKEGEGMISYLPVQIDGCSNLIQHYAGLFRDPHLAQISNLRANKPWEDFYTTLAGALNKTVLTDERRGKEASFHWKKNPLVRKEIKQIFLVLNYGGTEYGVKKKLIHIWFSQPRAKYQNYRYAHAIGYMVNQLVALYKKFLPKIKEYNELLNKFPKEVRGKEEGISWKGETGFTTFCYKERTSAHITYFGKSKNDSFNIPAFEDVAKERRSIAPNLIHSLDATHMTQILNKIQQEQMQVIGIHDGFATHAVDVEALKRIVKKKFIGIYSKDVLKKFLSSVSSSHIPELGTWDVNEVIHSTDAFS